MSNSSDTMNATIRRATGHQMDPPEEEMPSGEQTTPDFDGGARTSASAPRPSMSRLIRAAAGTGPPDLKAQRWIAEH